MTHGALNRLLVRAAKGDGQQCDRCGSCVGAELRACRIESKAITLRGPRPEMRLCLPCIGALEKIGATIHVKLTSAELRKQLRVLSPNSHALEPPPPELESSPLPRSTARRAPGIVQNAAYKAIEIARAQGRLDEHAEERAVALLSAAIERTCASLTKAAKASAVREREQQRTEAQRAKARQALAAELRTAKAKRSALQKDIERAGELLAARGKMLAPPSGRLELAAQMRRTRARLALLREACAKGSAEWSATFTPPAAGTYPDIPRGSIVPSRDGSGLPNAPGVYFLWAGDTVEYVGQSVRLAGRVKLGHDRVRPDHRISFVVLDRCELTWAECWYIGSLRPKLNFARMQAALEQQP